MSDPTTQAEGLGQEITTDVSTFIQTVEGDLVTIADNAYNWAKAELQKLEPAVLAELQAAIVKALQDVEAGDTIGEIVADVLDILYNGGSAAAQNVSSDLITAVTSLTTAKVPAAG